MIRAILATALVALFATSMAVAKPSDLVDALPLKGDFNPAGGEDTLVGAAIQPDGKLMLAGRCKSGAFFYFCLARFKADFTSLDDTFDGTSNGNGRIRVAIGPDNDLAIRLTVQPDGKILVAGICAEAGGATTNWCIMRLNDSGTFDSTFTGPTGSSNGRFMLPFGSSGVPRLNDMKLLPDGRILLVGSCMAGIARRFCMVRLTASGALDPSFNPSGGVPGQYVDNLDGSSGLSGDREANASAIYPDGSIVLAIHCNVNQLCAAKFSSSAALQSVAPFAAPAGAASATPTSVAIDAAGRPVMTGYCETPQGVYMFCAYRFTIVLGLLGVDATFDGPSGSGNGRFALTMTGNGDHSQQVLPLSDGRLLIVGTCRNLADTGNTACVGVLNADGSFDRNFGVSNNGWQRYDFGGSYQPSSLRSAVVLPSGNIALAGTCNTDVNSDWCLFRIEGWPEMQAATCRADIDGDGEVQSTRDALILSRVAAGMVGAAVLNGITFSPNATRTSWPAIRDYLVLRCGMRLSP